jgi:hypothetical protein
LSSQSHEKYIYSLWDDVDLTHSTQSTSFMLQISPSNSILNHTTQVLIHVACLNNRPPRMSNWRYEGVKVIVVHTHNITSYPYVHLTYTPRLGGGGTNQVNNALTLSKTLHETFTSNNHGSCCVLSELCFEILYSWIKNLNYIT